MSLFERASTGGDLIFGAVPYDCDAFAAWRSRWGVRRFCTDGKACPATLVEAGQDPVKRLSWQSMNCCSILRCMRAVFPRPPRDGWIPQLIILPTSCTRT
jgi:hypothetical protein